MKIFSWNVNGIRAVINKGEFKKFISHYQPDVLCLQETKAKKGQAEIDLPDYEEFWNSAERAGYSGTAIFTKIKPIGVTFDEAFDDLADKYGDLNKEGRVTTLEFDDFYLVTVYTPNAKDDLSRLSVRQQWDEAFLKYLKTLHQTKPVIFCGDLNVAHREIDLANPKQNVGKHGFTHEERHGFDEFLRVGFVDSFRELHPSKKNAYTWWTHWANARERNVGWRIDYFLVDKKLRKKLVGAEILAKQMGSDHCPVMIETSF